ncbi:MAG TPA: FtsX-like permease family protein [Devosiaceae bacterium]
MLYQFKIAFRYLTSSLVQTGLLVLGVAVGVFVFVFMSALIGGLAVYLIDQTVGDISHVTVSAPEQVPAKLYSPSEGALIYTQSSTGRQTQLRNSAEVLATLRQLPGLVSASPEIVGNGFVRRGAVVNPVSIIGVEPANVSAIANVRSRLVSGTDSLPIGSVLIGKKLSEDLGIAVGQGLRVRSDRGVDLTLTVAGIFAFGLDALDERTAYVNLKTARGLFEIRHGITRIETRITSLWDAPAFARAAADATGLKAVAWTESNAQLLSGLDAQARSGTIIKAFALITIVIGVASALLLSTYRRRPEIGIMRAMGASRGFVVMVFVSQGALIGLGGGLLGAALGFAALSPFPPPDQITSGSLPIDVNQGGFGLAIALTLAGAIIASILPARAAAKVDPVTVISQ